MRLNKGIKHIGILIVVGLVCFYFFPYLFNQTVIWQKVFNQNISSYLHDIQQHPIQSGGSLVAMSFIYGILHAVGPGHGKFIIASYLSTHQSQFKTSIQLTLLASLMQGFVAILITSFVVVVLKLSSSYFKLSQLWLERSAFILMIMLGCYWIYQSAVQFYKEFKKSKKRPFNKIYAIKPFVQETSLISDKLNLSEHNHCSCGHQHLPSSQQLAQATDFRSRLLVILAIGIRPCSGAIFILFLSYMLELYEWGMIATMAMAVGTGIALSLFALIVQYARQSAIKLGNWYLSAAIKPYSASGLKFIAGGIIIFFAIALLYGTTLPASGGAVLFGG